MVPPSLRDELSLHPGPVGHDGAPSWTLHDPVRNQFFRLSWPAFEILSRWHLGEPEVVAEAINHDTTLNLGAEDVVDIAEFLARNQLLKPAGPKDTDRLLAIHDAAKTSWLTWALHHYLFFRIPLVQPDQMLNRLFPLVAWIGLRGFRLATFTVLLLGLLVVGRQWNTFTTTLEDHLSITGLAAFGLALGFAKVVHELGHAFTAKAMGCRVPTMGVAFLVLMPMLYTDCNEAWKLTCRRQRLLIGGAGILAELSLAAWATLAWGLLPDGPARSIAFTLATTTWVSSVVINLSPFMRFDGYFLAMDALDQPNLHPRSFALARWHLREVLFALNEPAPERLPPNTRGGMIVFAWAVWIYRLILFLGIAVLVYHFFIKVIGVLLFVVEMGWFVFRPFLSEFAQWGKRWTAIRSSRRSRLSFGLLAGLVLLAVIPWNGRVTAPAVLKAAGHATLYAPVPALLMSLEVAEDQNVTPGQILAKLDNPDLRRRLGQTEGRVVVLKYELTSAGFEESFRNRSQAIAKGLESALAEKAALIGEIQRLSLTATLAGTVADLSPNLQPGQWISPKDPILSIRKGTVIDAFLAEDDLLRIQPGAKARFIPEGSGASLSATVQSIDSMAVRNLMEPVLASQFGGAIPARIDRQSLVPESAIYRVRLLLDNDQDTAVTLRGEAHMEGEARSALSRLLRTAAAVILREWGT
jgi:putative peptide zinc metalloprotease protein